MRWIKTLGLAAVAAMAAMAFVGASSATAAEHEQIILCEAAELPCFESPYPNPTEIHAEAGDPELLSSIGTILCKNSLAIVTLLNKLKPLVEAHLLALNFTGCNLGSTSCTITVNALGGLSLTPDEEKLKAIVQLIELEGKNTNATVKCGAFINCTYSANAETKLLAHSDAEGHLLLLANETPLSGKGFLCPATSKLDATYHAVNLDEPLSLKTGLWIEL